MRKITLFVLAALCAPLFVSPSPVFAKTPVCVREVVTPQVSVFLIVNGVFVDITEDASWSDGHVFLCGVDLGSVSDGWIEDSSGQVVGFVSVLEGGIG